MALSSTDVPIVYSLLQNALSQDELVRKPAEAALSSCENRPGFCSCLLEIIAARDLEERTSARWLSSVYLKNSINKYWRTRRDSLGLSEAEKLHLRGKLLELIREENNQVAIQLATIISKISRFDYPREWHDLFPNLLQKAQSSDILINQRVFMVFNQVLKELSTKRLAADQHNFAQITSQLFEYTWHQWCRDTQRILLDFSTAMANPRSDVLSVSQEQALSCERWLLCLKTIQRMILFGFQSDAKSIQEVTSVTQVCPAALQTIQSFLQYRNLLQKFQPFIERGCLKLMKMLVMIQTTHPFSFSSKNVFPLVLDFVWIQLTEQNWEGGLFEHLLIQCMLFIQNVLQCVSYKATKLGRALDEPLLTKDEEKATLSSQAEATLHSILDEKRVVLLCEALVKRYFVYTAKDLEDWAHDPEGFYHEQDLVQWRERLRPCAESLFIVLFENYREVLAPIKIQILNSALQNCPPPAPDAPVEITSSLLLKEAVYNAVGIANYDLYDYIDFNSWYSGVLSQELKNEHPNNRILRRRIAWLMGQWVNKIKDDMRRPIYAALMKLLADNDLAVQLAACRSLHMLIDDVHFYEEEFVEFVPGCFELLFQFMCKAQDFDSKIQIFNLVSLIVDQVGEKVIPCTSKILTFLQQVWQESEGQSLLKIQIVLALQRLVIALGPQSPCCYELLLAILQHVTDINQPDELNMLEDGLHLWQTTIRHAPAMIPQLLSIFPHLVDVMERSLDYLQVAMQIIESYVLLDGAQFLQHHAIGVVRILNLVVGNVKEKGMLCTLSVIDTIIQCFPGDAPRLFEDILQKLFMIVVSGSEEADIVKASAGAILARVLVQNSEFFARLTSQPSLCYMLKESGVSKDNSPVFMFFDSWLDKVDSLTTASKRKICALALCILLTSREPQILDRLEQILSVCTSIAHETEDEKNGFAGSYDTSAESEPQRPESEDTRKRQVTEADPVYKLAVVPLLKEKLQVCAAMHGEAAFNGALSRLHPSLLGQLQQLMQQTPAPCQR